MQNLESYNKKGKSMILSSDAISIHTPVSKIGFHCLNSILGNEFGHDKCNREYCNCLCHYNVNSTEFGIT